MSDLDSYSMSCGGSDLPQYIADERYGQLRSAVKDPAPVAGLTHRFYRYPARFSPTFAGTVIDLFSAPGDLILDPYMGGGTSVVEAIARGRRVVGCDINSLASFLGRVKTTPLAEIDRASLRLWADRIVPTLSYWHTPADLTDFICDRRAYNLTLPNARPIKKALALALRTLDQLSSVPAQEFARCALLNAAQAFLNGQRRHGTVAEFRSRVQTSVHEMLAQLSELEARKPPFTPILLNNSAVDLPTLAPFTDGARASLVVTSPPYPGIHMLYHRWQVDGRRETPAPYWLANCEDGQGNAYYNFADRRDAAESRYFEESLKTLRAIRRVMKDGAAIAQLIAFSDPPRQLPQYLKNMTTAGFREIRFDGRRRIWRDVPSRRWHANLKGRTGGSREVLLLHGAD